MARLGRGFRSPFYYGSVDSHAAIRHSRGASTSSARMILGLISELWPNIDAALNWIDTYGDRGRGTDFVEYQGRAKTGLTNQGWKDSADSIFHADGSDPVGPIALCEVQGLRLRCEAPSERRWPPLPAAQKRADEVGALGPRNSGLRFEEAFLVRRHRDLCARARWPESGPCRVAPRPMAGQLLFTGHRLKGKSGRR